MTMTHRSTDVERKIVFQARGQYLATFFAVLLVAGTNAVVAEWPIRIALFILVALSYLLLVVRSRRVMSYLTPTAYIEQSWVKTRITPLEDLVEVRIPPRTFGVAHAVLKSGVSMNLWELWIGGNFWGHAAGRRGVRLLNEAIRSRHDGSIHT